MAEECPQLTGEVRPALLQRHPALHRRVATTVLDGREIQVRALSRKTAVTKQPAEFDSMHQITERRMNPRDRTTTQAVIWRDDPYSIVICTVRNLSPGGAGLVLPDTVLSLPPEFDLTFDRVTYRCIAVWRHLGRMGVKFKSSYVV
jgi:hypothetical protein